MNTKAPKQTGVSEKGAAALTGRRSFMRSGDVEMALFGRIWSRNRVQVIDVEFTASCKGTRYELRRYPDQNDWILVRIFTNEKLLSSFEKVLGKGSLATMKQLLDTLIPQAQSA